MAGEGVKHHSPCDFHGQKFVNPHIHIAGNLCPEQHKWHDGQEMRVLNVLQAETQSKKEGETAWSTWIGYSLRTYNILLVGLGIGGPIADL